MNLFTILRILCPQQSTVVASTNSNAELFPLGLKLLCQTDTRVPERTLVVSWAARDLFQAIDFSEAYLLYPFAGWLAACTHFLGDSRLQLRSRPIADRVLGCTHGERSANR